MQHQDLWNLLELQMPVHEREIFIKSFSSDDIGKANAWALSEQLRSVITKKKKQNRMSILVECRPFIGWGVWVVLAGRNSHDRTIRESV